MIMLCEAKLPIGELGGLPWQSSSLADLKAQPRRVTLVTDKAMLEMIILQTAEAIHINIRQAFHKPCVFL